MQYKTLIDVPTLSANLGHPDWALFDCRANLMRPAAGREAYDQGHVPGARFVDLETDLSGPVTPRTGRHPLPDVETLAVKLGEWGVDRMVQVVVYDADNGAFASRLWWLLRWLGHDAVALLDGGYRAWTEAAGAVTTAEPDRAPRRFTAEPRPDLAVEVGALIDEAHGPLIDARTPERFRGEKEPIDPVAGRIPGSLNLPLQGNLDARGRYLPATRGSAPATTCSRWSMRDCTARDSTSAPGASGSGTLSARSRPGSCFSDRRGSGPARRQGAASS
jgi:thiosulfate/3-mercaptopyruvate sulfurtransferase